MNNRCVVRGAPCNPGGFTLLEVIVVLAVMGVVLGMSGLALASLKVPRESERIRELRHARSEAIRTGRPIHVETNRASLTAHILFLPDGRAVGLGVNPLTGAPHDSTR